jgi:subtilisin
MSKVLRAVLAVGALGATLLGGSVLAADAAPSKEPYIVVLEESADPDRVAQQAHAQHGAELGHVYRHALKGFSARISDRAASALAHNPQVDFVEHDSSVTVAAQTLPTGINRIDAELSPTAKIDGLDERVNVDVAVIDTGIDLDHPDLNVTAGRNCTLLGRLLGRSPDDDNGHGSHVAGTIGAKDNSVGVVGVAPGARVVPVKVLSAAGAGSNSDVICGIDWVTARASTIEVANMSLGGSGSDDRNCGNSNNDALHRAICRSVAAGITYAVAAGNDHRDSAGFTPAAYDEVITTSALADFNGLPGGGAPPTCRQDVDDTFADFSNFGADVDVIAPGVCILSTWMNGGYNTISGTSMASPHAAGAAALYKATHPSATPVQVKAALQAAGTLDWIWPSQDGDATQERLVNVAGF